MMALVATELQDRAETLCEACDDSGWLPKS